MMLLLSGRPLELLLVSAGWLRLQLAAVRPPLFGARRTSDSGQRVGQLPGRVGRRLPDRCEFSRGWLLHSGGESCEHAQQSTTSIAVRRPARSGMNSRPEPALHTRFSTITSDQPQIARPGPRLSSLGPRPGRSTGSPLGVSLYVPRNIYEITLKRQVTHKKICKQYRFPARTDRK